jgi:hypothetical protein
MDEVSELILGKPAKIVVTDQLLDAVKAVESGGNARAVNPQSGAMGAYQFMPGTVKALQSQGVKFDPFNEPQAREAARGYLQTLLDKNGGDVDKALAQYGGFVTKDPSGYISKVKSKLPAAPTDEISALILGTEKATEPAPKPSPKPVPFSSSGLPEGNLIRKIMQDRLAPKPASTAPTATAVTGSTATPDQIPGSINQTRVQDPSLLERVIAGPETAARMIYGAGTALIAAPVGVGKEILTGTPKEETARKIMELGSDVPMSPGARANLESLGSLTSNLPAFVPAIGQAGQISQGLKYASGRSALTAEQALRDQFAAKALPPRVEPGIGAPAPAAPAPGQPKPRVTYAELQAQLAEKKAAKEQAFEDLANAPSLQEAQARGTLGAGLAQPIGGAGATPGSVGAAAVDTPRARAEKAANLPVPITIDRAQATRNPTDVKFAGVAAKTPHLAEQVFEHYADQNAKVQQNMQAGIESTGTQAQGIPATDFGQKVKDYVQGIKDARMADIRTKYAAAEAAGELATPVSYQPVLDLISKETGGRPTVASLNPLYKILEEEFAVNDPSGSRTIGVRQLEDVRQLINDQTDWTDKRQKALSTKVKRLIDGITEKAGGDIYKQARQERAQWSNDFENQSTVRSINEIKKGTTDPAVSTEKIFDDIFLRKSGDQVRKVFDLLDRSGPEGQQLVRDIKGRFAEHILENTTKNVQLDTKGRPYVSTPELNKLVTSLDKSGKLDLVFGPEWANHYRTLNEVVKEIQTKPREVLSTSGSGETILGAIGGLGIEAAGRVFADEPGLGLLAYGGGKLLNVARENRKISREQTKLKDFLNYKP